MPLFTPPAKVLAPEVHRTFRETWRPVLADLGFQRTPGYESWSAWSRRVDGGEWQTAWMQLNAHGWRDWLGSCLTVELQQDASSEPGASPDRRGRWSYFMEPSTLREVESAQRVIRGRRVPIGVRLTTRVEQGLLDSMAALHKDDRYEPGKDIWLLYRADDDVQAWAQFFAERLPVMVERLLTFRRP